MELVEVRTSRSGSRAVRCRLTTRSTIARQIADALAAAPQTADRPSRPRSPRDIKIRHDGAVKVLDFGLCETGGRWIGEGCGLTKSPTLTSPVMVTSTGTILGTAAYMSPEQARGRSVAPPHRRLGVRVRAHEMLAGRRSFDGSDVTEVLAAVMKDAPAFDALRRPMCRRPSGVCSGGASKGSVQTPRLDARRAPRDR